jgi:hypothetical protein
MDHRTDDPGGWRYRHVAACDSFERPARKDSYG